jgi:hypothetical protein
LPLDSRLHGNDERKKYKEVYIQDTRNLDTSAINNNFLDAIRNLRQYFSKAY